MKTLVKSRISLWMAALGVACLTLMASAAARAEEVTSKTLVDHLQIQDLITRYYNNFGRENPENFSDFYADDAELILGSKSFKGKDGTEVPDGWKE